MTLHMVFGSIYIVWTLIFIIWAWLLSKNTSGGSGTLGIIFFSCVAYWAGIIMNSIAYAIWFRQWIFVILIIMIAAHTWGKFRDSFE